LGYTKNVIVVLIFSHRPWCLAFSGGNKTDDEKLLEAQSIADISPDVRDGAAVVSSPPATIRRRQAEEELDSTSDDARTAASSGPVPDPVVTDDMKTSAGDR
jgi:hypothetical protein